jgi:ribonucleoside-diphosphate reductase alpha chain
MQIMPSMRAFWAAGAALERENIMAYNCTAAVIDRPKAFSEILYLLMCTCGTSFSVESRYVFRLPKLPKQLAKSSEIIIVEDTRMGWARAVNRLINKLYAGEIPLWDLSKIRPEGAVLKTSGGRASGPGPLNNLMVNIVDIFTRRVNSCMCADRLTTLDCMDIACHIANAVVAGGMRRSATMCVSDPDDHEVLNSKSGRFWETNPQRQLTNISPAWERKPDVLTFLEDWMQLIKSGTGEPGIFNRAAAQLGAASTGRRDPNHAFIPNPCGETVLRPNEMCNLTSCIIRPNSSDIELRKVVKAATLIGCVQSTLTDFHYVNKEFTTNCEEERLLGVSLAGLRDHYILQWVSPESITLLKSLRESAWIEAERVSNILGIKMPTAITLVKPEGTVSQLVNASPGVHPRFSDYYIRRLRISKTDPIVRLLHDHGFKSQIDWTQDETDYNRVVFEFPIKSPINSVLVRHVDAIMQLNYWKMLKEYWCDHNASCTIYVKDNEWLKVGNWIYENWDSICGLSFYPVSSGLQPLPPYEEINQEKFDHMVASFPKYGVDFNQLTKYETSDETTGTKEYACAGGKCEI